VDLGDGAAINDSVAAFRKELRNPRSTNIKQVGQDLYRKVMRPLVQLLGNTHKFISFADGDLNSFHSAPWLTSKVAILIENYSITYLTSGRDLLRLQVQADQ